MLARHNARKGELVELFLYNFVNNYLYDTNINKIEIYGGNELIDVITTAEHVDLGTYRTIWRVPSDDITSPYFRPGFVYSVLRDVWYTSNGTFTQYLLLDINPANVRRPYIFDFNLLTDTITIGSITYIQIQVTESTGLDAKDFPPARYIITKNGMVVAIGKAIKTNDIYNIPIDTTLINGIVNVSLILEVRSGIIKNKASLTMNTAGGIIAEHDLSLTLNIDNIIRQTILPSTQSPARITLPVKNYDFSGLSSDIFSGSINGTEFALRLLSLPSRTIIDVVQELNNDFSFISNLYKFPAISNSIDISTISDWTIFNNTTLSIQIDNNTYNITFTNITGVSDIINAINSAVGDTIAFTFNNRIILATPNLKNFTFILILGGSAVSALGFIINQSDSTPHTLPNATITIDTNKIKISASDNIKIYNSLVSSANLQLGFPADGIIVSNTPAQNASISATNSFSTFVSRPVKPAILKASFGANYQTIYNISGNPGELVINSTQITFSPIIIPGMASSILNNSVFKLPANHTIVIRYNNTDYNMVINSQSTDAFMTVDQVAAAINNGAVLNNIPISGIVYNGYLSIKANTNTNTFYIKLDQNAIALGFTSNIINSGINQNDGLAIVQIGGADYIRVSPYTRKYTKQDIVDTINNGINSVIASLDNNGDLVLRTVSVGSSAVLSVSGTAVNSSYLNFGGTTSKNGEDALNNHIHIDLGNQSDDIYFDEGILSVPQVLQKLQSSPLITPTLVDNKLVISANGPGVLTLTSNDNTLLALGFSSQNVSANDIPAVPAEIISSPNPTLNFRNSNNAILIFRNDPTQNYTTLNISNVQTSNDLVYALSPYFTSIFISGNEIIIVDDYIEIASMQAGSLANVQIGIGIFGITSFSHKSNRYTAADIAGFINNTYANSDIALSDGGIVTIRSIQSGSSAFIKVIEPTSLELKELFTTLLAFGSDTDILPQTVSSKPFIVRIV